MVSTSVIQHPEKLFINGTWVDSSSDARIDVIDSNTEGLFLSIAEALPADVEHAIAAARSAFDEGPWPRLGHQQRGDYLRSMAVELRKRSDALSEIWPRESGELFRIACGGGELGAGILERYASLDVDYAWEEPANPTNGGEFGLIVREPVGVVGAIIPWNSPITAALHKMAPALMAGCTVVLKGSPEAPGAGYLLAEAAEAVGLPPGVLNVITAQREASEVLVRDPRVEKISFTGSTATGRRIGSIMGERIGRFTLELGGKSAAVILGDADMEGAASSIAAAECRLAGQVCASLTRLIVPRSRHDEFVDALASKFSSKRVGDAFDPSTDIGPLVSAQQRKRVEGYIQRGIAEGATLVTGGGRPKDLDRGFFVEPTVFANVDNASTIGREEIFGPVLTVIAADDEDHAIRIANDSPYGLNASVFTKDVDHARKVAGRLRSGTVGHNAYRIDFGLGFGGFKQSGIGREGVREGVAAYLESKVVILDGPPHRYRD
jgi:aldehyde dehydrogenase (NAD+)